MADYSGEIATALELIQEYGGAISFRRMEVVGYDPEEDEYASDDPEAPEFIPDPEQVASSFAVRLPPDSEGMQDTRQARAVATFYVAALGLSFPPEPGMKADFANDEWDVMTVDPLDPDGASPIIYTLTMEQ